MDKQKNERIKEVKIEEIQEVSFGEFERTMKKIVQSKMKKKELKKG